jgi:hypothetical protein
MGCREALFGQKRKAVNSLCNGISMASVFDTLRKRTSKWEGFRRRSRVGKRKIGRRTTRRRTTSSIRHFLLSWYKISLLKEYL